ncbi:MAG: hypothetical protein JWN44_1997 [Myxococcales bacterium]|nr:hypothetical protein [Myxococcales bacterium]
MRSFAAYLPLAIVLSALPGCGGASDCPALTLNMQSLAAQASAVDILVYDSTSRCGGNDVAAGAAAPVVSRHLDGHAGTTLQLPSGQYVVVMHAFDAGGAFIGSACQAELFTPGQRACVSVALSTPMLDPDGGVADLATGGGGGGGAGAAGGGGGGGGGGAANGDMAVTPFTVQSSGVTTSLYQAWSAGNGVVYVVGAAGVILKTTNGGTTWTKQTSGTASDLEAVWGSSATDVTIAGFKGTVLHTTNGGTSWTLVSVGVTTNLFDIWGAGAGDIYITGDRGVVLHGNGTSFSAVGTSAGMTPVNCVWGSSASEVFLFGGAGLVMEGTAAGGFSKTLSPTGDYFNYGWGTPGGVDIWIPSMNSAGTSSTLWHSANHGGSFQSQLTTASPLWAVWANDAGDAFVVGDQILESTDHGATWNSAGPTPALLYGIGGDAAGTAVWTVGVNGTILHRP